MSVTQTMTESNTQKFNSFKRDLNKNKLFASKVNLTELEIPSDEFIEYNGNTLPISKDAFKDLIRILGLNKKILKNFSEFMSDEAKFALIKAMQRGLANTENREIFLYASAQTKTVERILTKKRPGISDQNYLELVDRVLNENPNFEINSFTTDYRGTAVNLVNPNSPIGLNGFADESFHFGLSVENNFRKGTVVSPFNERLICSNGMVTRRSMGAFELNELTADSWNDFSEHMNSLKSNDYIAPGFMGGVKKAIETPASVLEVDQARSSILSRCKMSENDVDLWIPTANMTNKYMAAGIDLETTTHEKKATAQSDKTIWDLVNAMTNVASHSHNFEMSEFQRNLLKAEAGDLLYKEAYNMNNIMNVNPYA